MKVCFGLGHFVYSPSIHPTAFTSSVQFPFTQLVDNTMHDKRTYGLLSRIN
jgi:hypothetical protein